MRANSLFHGLKRVVGLAVIKLVNDAGVIQRVQLDMGPKGADGPRQLRDDTPVLQQFGFTSHPPLGSDVAIIALGGDANQMVVIASGHREYRITALPEGAVAVYDKFGHHVRLDADGIHVLGDTVFDGNVTINGDVAVTGDTTLTGNLGVTGNTALTGDLSVTGNTSLTGALAVDGAMTATGDITDQSAGNTVTVAAVRVAYNLHKHSGVQAGGAVSGISDHLAT